MLNPVAQFFASLQENNTYTFLQAMKQPDCCKFAEEMMKETGAHHEKGLWIICRCSSAGNPKTIMSIWLFKRKRAPDGRITKYKARICAHGRQQQWGINYWETFLPVVNWLSVRAMLIVALINNLLAQFIDFMLSFLQAELDVPVFMELLPGMMVEDREPGEQIIKLKHLLYKLKQASHNWYTKLQGDLKVIGFHASKVDPCVFISTNIVFLVYVNNCIVFTHKGKEEEIERLIKRLEGKFELTNEGSLKYYLGIKFARHLDELLKMTQPHLIYRITNALELRNKIKNTKKI